GAVDFVAKPRIGVAGGLEALASEIVEKLRIAARARLRSARKPAASTAGVHPAAEQPGAPATGSVPASAAQLGSASRAGAAASASVTQRRWLTTEKLVFIGASTGGTEATREVLVQLPADFPAIL